MTHYTLYSKHIYDNLNKARLELKQTDVALSYKPLFLTANTELFSDKPTADYVRVIPNTEGTMKHGDGSPYPGVYAEVWHK